MWTNVQSLARFSSTLRKYYPRPLRRVGPQDRGPSTSDVSTVENLDDHPRKRGTCRVGVEGDPVVLPPESLGRGSYVDPSVRTLHRCPPTRSRTKDVLRRRRPLRTVGGRDPGGDGDRVGQRCPVGLTRNAFTYPRGQGDECRKVSEGDPSLRTDGTVTPEKGVRGRVPRVPGRVGGGSSTDV